MIIASWFAEYTDLDEVWFIVSPQNPLKKRSSLLADNHRLILARIATEDDPRFRVSNIEFQMPKPSYTIDTLTYLSEKYPERKFVLLAGSDQLPTLHKWKNPDVLLDLYSMFIYKRPGFEISEYNDQPNITIFNTPLIEISSSFIRKSIKEGKDMRYMMPEKVAQYVREMHFYEK